MLGKTLLNAAENHAKARGFGMMDLNGRHYTWVLSRLAIEMNDMPRVYDEIGVSTWVESIYRLFTNRNFSVVGTDGTVYGYARSIWAMIDYETRQPAQLEQMEGEVFQQFLIPEEPCPIEPQGRVRPLHDEDFVKAHHAKYSDIDMNGHVNSIKYIEHIMDLSPSRHTKTAEIFTAWKLPTWRRVTMATSSLSSAESWTTMPTRLRCAKVSSLAATVVLLWFVRCCVFKKIA